jgi:transcriptional regulator with XRE-family HTH domain
MKLRIDGERVHALMREKGIRSVQELAAMSGVHANTLTPVLRGGGWSARTAERLAAALGCNPIDLLVSEGYPEPFWKMNQRIAELLKEAAR